MLEYAVPASNVTVANQPVTLVWVGASDAKPIAIMRCYWAQSSTATSAQQRIRLQYQASPFPSGLTAVTPIKLNTSDPVSSILGAASGPGGSGVNATTENAGAVTTLYSDSVNNLNGFLWVPSPVEMIVMNNRIADKGFGLHLVAAPTALSGQNGGVHFKELA